MKIGDAIFIIFIWIVILHGCDNGIVYKINNKSYHVSFESFKEPTNE